MRLTLGGDIGISAREESLGYKMSLAVALGLLDPLPFLDELCWRVAIFFMAVFKYFWSSDARLLVFIDVLVSCDYSSTSYYLVSGFLPMINFFGRLKCGSCGVEENVTNGASIFSTDGLTGFRHWPLVSF